MERICLVYDNLSYYKAGIKSYLDDGWKIKYQSKKCDLSRKSCNKSVYSRGNIVTVIERKKTEKINKKDSFLL